MDRIHFTSKPLDDEHAAEYIAVMAEQLMAIARSRKLRMLTYLLSLVAHEARDVATSQLAALRDWPIRLSRTSTFKPQLERTR